MKEIFKENGRQLDFSKDEFALELKKYRLRRGLSQRQLGAEWGLSRYTILRAENAKNLTWMSAYRLFSKLAEGLRKEEGGAL